MSYDLFFCVPNRREPISAAAMRAYFSERPQYQVHDRQAWYQHENTGVYFSFEYDDAVEPKPEGYSNVMFNMNLLRPHVFGLEAEPEIRAFVESFDLQVDDPQSGQRVTYSGDDFLRSWNAGNEFAYRGMPGVARMKAAPTQEIENAWRWNYNLGRLNTELFDLDVFTPTVFFLDDDGRAASYVVWGDGCAIAIPPVTYILLGRQELRPVRQTRLRRLLGRQSDKDWCLVPMARATDILDIGETREAEVPYHLLDYDRPPPEVRSFIQEQEGSPALPETVPFDQVLNLELVQSQS